MSSADLWQNKDRAQEALNQVKSVEESIGFLLGSESEVLKLTEEYKFLQGIPEEERDIDWRINYNEFQDELRKIFDLLSKKQSLLLFNGLHDQNDAVISIQSGAGGTDAQDWADMLLKMYLKYIEKKDFVVNIIDKTPGKEAGIKSVEIQVKGPFAYGYFRGEHGVHRLVRISPFNSGGSRETSFAFVEVVPFITDIPLEIQENDLKIETFRAGGPGGQHVNTTSSAVRITHSPSGIVVVCQNERSQMQNKLLAMEVLKAKLLKRKEEADKENLLSLRGERKDAAWGNQIRSYVLQPYTLVKDHRTNFSTSQVDKVLSGDLDELINSYLNWENQQKD